MTSISPLTLVLVDSAVHDYKSLVENLRCEAEVIVLNPDQDGVEQITEALAARTNIESLHILSHGDLGRVYLGSTQLNSETLDLYVDQLQGWQQAFTPSADILLYGCEVAAKVVGQQFVQRLSELTQTNIAASTNLTGSAALDGDWDLEFTTGEIHAPLVFQPEAIASYEFVLATVLLDESFRNNDVTDNTAWIYGKGTGAADPFLTARTVAPPSGAGGLPGGGSDTNGNGVLRLTNNTNNQASFVIYNKPIASTEGLSITFDLFSYGGSGGADGISFFLFDAAQTNITVGAFGGSLGYAQRDVPAITGIAGGYLGVGFDEFGNYSSGTEGRVNVVGTGGVIADAIAIRGSAANQYQYLTGSGTLTPGIDNLSATTRNDAGTKKTAKIDITPSGSTATVSVKIDLNGDGDFLDANEAPAALTNYTVPTINGNLPANFKLGFASSTGANTNIHEVRNLKVTNATPGVSFSGTGVTLGIGGVPSVTTVEGGAAITVNAVLNTRPTSNVTLNLLSNDTTEGTASPLALVFTPDNWDVPQALTLTPVDDAIADGNIFYTIGTSLVSTDAVYTAINPADINVTNNDNETASPNVVLTLTGSPLAEGGGVATVTATLSKAATVPVTIGLGFTGTATNGIDYIPSASSITIAPGGISGIATLTGRADVLTEDNESVIVSATSITGGTATTPQQVTAIITDATVAPNSPPIFPPIVSPAVAAGGTTGIPGLTAIDADGIGSYTITAVPASAQGSLFLGDPARGGTLVSVGQAIAPTQIGQLFFRAGQGFTGSSFAYTATDSRGATATPQVVPLRAVTVPIPDPQEDNCVDGTPINGTNGKNKLDGADGVNDTISGKDGNDRLRGLSCNDVLDGGGGNDRILGGTGRDTLRGRIGNDTLLGGAANDVLNGGLGSDRLDGGEGDDTLKGRRGLDLLIGGSGNDVLSGGLRNDRLRGGSGNDVVDGDQGDDFVKGGGGNDILLGRTGRDTLVGFAGNDTISGGLGNDLIVGSVGADRLTGKRGRDVFEYRSLQDGGDTITDFATNRDSINLSRISGGRSFGSFVTLSQSGSDTLVRVSSGSSLTTLATLTGVTASTLGAGNFVV